MKTEIVINFEQISFGGKLYKKALVIRQECEYDASDELSIHSEEIYFLAKNRVMEGWRFVNVEKRTTEFSGYRRTEEYPVVSATIRHQLDKDLFNGKSAETAKID